MSPMGLNDVPAVDPRKARRGRARRRDRDAAGRDDVRPCDPHARGVRQRDRRGRRDGGLDERRAAPAGDRARGGLPLTIDDFDAISAPTPVLADLKPGGRFIAVDMTRAGGVALVARGWREAGLVTATRRTSTARRWPSRRGGAGDGGPGGRRARRARRSSRGRPRDPARQPGARRAAVVKLAGHERKLHRGPARVFDSEEDVLRGRPGAARSSPATWS